MANYLYNGVELPALPEWDREKYPYAVIWRFEVDGSKYGLTIFDKPVKWYDFGDEDLLFVAQEYSETYDGEWTASAQFSILRVKTQIR